MRLSLIKSINHVNNYTSVCAWVEHIRDMAKLKSEEVLRAHMSYSLKNKATNWYDSDFTELEKDTLRLLLEKGWYEQWLQR